MKCILYIVQLVHRIYKTNIDNIVKMKLKWLLIKIIFILKYEYVFGFSLKTQKIFKYVIKKVKCSSFK